jgi:xanthine dehydrogenase/oxidase
MSADMYGMATLDACRQILARLEPVRKELGTKASFKEVVVAAHFNRIDLSAHGFFALNSIRCGYDWTKERPLDWSDDLPENSWRGQPFNYLTQGCACTEVEVDLLSGNHKTLRSDLLVDVGSSINPMIDIGQIEGAFVQGMGWSTIEEVIYADDDHVWIRPRGSLFTTGPGTYKIPSFNDVPEVFNCTLLDKVDNPFAVHSSKAVGEPPFFLGTSVSTVMCHCCYI